MQPDRPNMLYIHSHTLALPSRVCTSEIVEDNGTSSGSSDTHAQTSSPA